MSQIDSSKRTNPSQSSSSGYPSLDLHEEKIFITVKTYPHPSVSYKEIVCTVGITENGKWIRLYPVDYRYMEYAQWYKKYQWIKVKIQKNTKDFRIDSYRPDVNSIKPQGTPISSEKGWSKRKDIIIPTIKYKSLEEIEDAYQKEGISIGIFKPKEIEDFIIEADTKDWSDNHQKALNQLVLFGEQPKHLTKIPFKFSYKFRCNDTRCTKSHKLAIFDWEIFMLYLNIRKNYPYAMDEVLQKIKDRYFTDMWNSNKDSYLIVGTQFPNPTFIVLGIFWPPKL